MSETWGLMPKSQIDPETIEEAINRIVAEHNAEPTAHSGDNEAIAVHRQNEILDHKAGAVLADKNTMSEFDYVVPLRDTYLWQTLENNDGFDYANPPGVDCAVWGIGEYCFRSALLTGLTAWFNWNKTMLIQFNMTINEHLHYIAYYALGDHASQTPTKGFGFVLDDDILKGFYVGSGGLVYTSSIPFTIEELTNLRAQYEPITRELNFYKNGELADTLIVANNAPTSSNARIYFGLKAKTSLAEAVAWCFDIYFAKGL
jgi:hypothetical protein